MNHGLEDVKLKMKALGLTGRQIDSIIKQTLAGRQWENLNAGEREQLLQSLEDRINFTRKLLAFLSCDTCSK